MIFGECPTFVHSNKIFDQKCIQRCWKIEYQGLDATTLMHLIAWTKKIGVMPCCREDLQNPFLWPMCFFFGILYFIIQVLFSWMIEILPSAILKCIVKNVFRPILWSDKFPSHFCRYTELIQLQNILVPNIKMHLTAYLKYCSVICLEIQKD